MFLTTNETTLWVHFREKKVISSEQLVSKTPIPMTPCQPNACQALPAKKVPIEPPTK